MNCTHQQGATSTRRIDIVGGGPVGLMTALILCHKPPCPIQIRVFDPRWHVKDGVTWKGSAEGNNRRSQVVTIQSNVYASIPRVIRDRLFSDDRTWKIWPHGPDSPECRGRPRNVRISDIEDVLLQFAREQPQIQLVPRSYQIPSEWHRADVDVLLIADGQRSRTRAQLQNRFGTPTREPFSLNGSPFDEVVLGVEVQSDLDPAATVPLTVCQNRFLFNPDGSGRGYINMRLTTAEAWEAVGLGPNEPVDCLQRQPCVMRAGAKRNECFVNAPVFKPAVDPHSYLWPRIQDGLRLFGVQPDGILGVTKFRLGMERQQQFVAELAPGKFALLVGDAAVALHFWPGRGLNTGWKGAVGAARCLHRLVARPLRQADFTKYQSFMNALQYREQGRAWTTMLMPRTDDSPYPICDRIAAGFGAQISRTACLSQLTHRITDIRRRLEPRMDQLPDIDWYTKRFADVSDESLRVFVETDPWVTTQVGGEEVSPDDYFPPVQE